MDLGGIFSVALSLGSPPLDVIQHLALRSSDFPPARYASGFNTGSVLASDRLAHFSIFCPINRATTIMILF